MFAESHAKRWQNRRRKVRGSGIVLLVEDNPEVATASTGLLEQLGYHVRWASDAAAALRNWKKISTSCSATLLCQGRWTGSAGQDDPRNESQTSDPSVTGYGAATEVASQFPILRKPYQFTN